MESKVWREWQSSELVILEDERVRVDWRNIIGLLGSLEGPFEIGVNKFIVQNLPYCYTYKSSATWIPADNQVHPRLTCKDRKTREFDMWKSVLVKWCKIQDGKEGKIIHWFGKSYINVGVRRSWKKKQLNRNSWTRNTGKGTVVRILLFSCSVLSESLWPHERQHARLPCPSLSPRVCSNSCPLSQWCHPTISSCCPLLLLPSIFPSIRVYSNESALCIRWLKYWSFRFSISASNEYSVLIPFRIDWFDFLAI